eukprot:TRINITY_DN5501_c0_g1_i3.p1 TRINITY_DN5501_c0_g1~~TRINITY_DN5501_c0_g1_i3.p1  ORF type:complete len:189 (+),score=36.42 TRINITY_DN5501_c0_g1_i3:194-760(+)
MHQSLPVGFEALFNNPNTSYTINTFEMNPSEDPFLRKETSEGSISGSSPLSSPVSSLSETGNPSPNPSPITTSPASPQMDTFQTKLNEIKKDYAAGLNKRKRTDQVEKPKNTGKRFAWSPELHNHFEEAMKTLGDTATAKNVMLLMEQNGADVSGLTRIRVANHMQHHLSRKNRLIVNTLSDAQKHIT